MGSKLFLHKKIGDFCIFAPRMHTSMNSRGSVFTLSVLLSMEGVGGDWYSRMYCITDTRLVERDPLGCLTSSGTIPPNQTKLWTDNPTPFPPKSQQLRWREACNLYSNFLLVRDFFKTTLSSCFVFAFKGGATTEHWFLYIVWICVFLATASRYITLHNHANALYKYVSWSFWWYHIYNFLTICFWSSETKKCLVLEFFFESFVWTDISVICKDIPTLFYLM